MADSDFFFRGIRFNVDDMILQMGIANWGRDLEAGTRAGATRLPPPHPTSPRTIKRSTHPTHPHPTSSQTRPSSTPPTPLTTKSLTRSIISSRSTPRATSEVVSSIRLSYFHTNNLLKFGCMHAYIRARITCLELIKFCSDRPHSLSAYLI